jgi:hypothetical protein
VDEEAWFFLARAIQDHILDPYGWTRDWQPFHSHPPSYDFAHPPLHWMMLALLQRVLGDSVISPSLSLSLTRALYASPFALLLGASTARLVESDARRPGLAALLWFFSPITLIGLQSGLMVDLPAVALLTASLAAWRSAHARTPAWATAAGLLLALACATKYPMLLALPALVVDASLDGRRAARGRALRLLASFLLVFGAIQGALYAAYGAFHPLAVLAGAGAIDRGPLDGRLLGTLVRAGVLFFPLAALWSRRGRRALLLMLPPAALLVVWTWPAEMNLPQSIFLVICALSGLSLVGMALRALRDSREDAFLALCLLAFVSGVVLLHNFASARYLWPMVLPAALLVTRAMDASRLPATSANPASTASRPPWTLLLLTALLGLSLAWANARYLLAVDDVASRIVVAGAPGRFTGEWGFRWRLEAAGWRHLGPARKSTEGSGLPLSPLLPGERVVAPLNASPGPLPLDGLALTATLESRDRFPLRLVDVGGRAGYYGETGGELPFWVGRSPLEVVRCYEVLQ